MGHLFITGTYRSGTTLVEKLLHALGQASVASQPLPLLYIEAKRAFLATLGHHDPHPLGHLFGEDRYRPEDLARFLDGWQLSPEDFDALLTRLEAAPGFWSPELLGRRQELRTGSFAAIRDDVIAVLADVHGRAAAPWKGSKEIICEEFIPYLLARGERIVLVIRDPRAVLRSVYLGAGPQFAGRVRPTLFHLRMWRKSVAMALAYEAHPAVVVVRYEDLLSDPDATVRRLSGLLGLGDIDTPSLSSLRDQHGRPWGGNSSFAGDPAPRASLGDEVERYIDAVCHPELAALGYPFGGGEPDAAALTSFVEPVVVDDPHLPPDYSTQVTNVEQELARLEQLRSGVAPPDVERWFIHRDAFERLREAVGSSRVGVDP